MPDAASDRDRRMLLGWQRGAAPGRDQVFGRDL